MAPSPSLSAVWAHFYPPKPRFAEHQVPDLHGRVYIVTGSNTGIGKEVARILYAKNAKVYVAARSEDRARRAIRDIQEAAPGSRGSLVFLALDLADLDSVKRAAQTFLGHEKKLHVLFNNAGVMVSSVEPPPRTAQGYELSLGVNCLGPLLFTELLTPALVATAEREPEATVRVVWLSSFALELFGVANTGVALDNLDYRVPKPAAERYGVSKVGTWALGVEYARRHRADGIVSLPVNPGNLTSELARDQGFLLKALVKIVGYPPVTGAATELFAGLSPEVTLDRSGDWVAPFGRFYPLRKDLLKAAQLESEGGTGGTLKFWEWAEAQIRPYL